MLPLAALAGDDLRLPPPTPPPALPKQPFDADAREYHFPTTVAAKLAIAEELGLPLTKLSPDDRAFAGSRRGHRRTCCTWQARAADNLALPSYFSPNVVAGNLTHHQARSARMCGQVCPRCWPLAAPLSGCGSNASAPLFP